jgi:tetratricopeptide (TPR) repeat protein
VRRQDFITLRVGPVAEPGWHLRRVRAGETMADWRGFMELTRVSYRAIVCTIVAALIAFAAPGGRAYAQGQSSPAELADVLWRQGYVLHVLGAYGQAVVLFQRSIEVHPTAEGHTFLGWSLSHLGRIEEAIAECKKAIAIDPDFGNPYNDIGVYLVELGRSDEATAWLEKAIQAKRYCCYQFAHFNLGRILLEKGKVPEAKRLFERALEYDPDYLPAKMALEEIRKSWL